MTFEADELSGLTTVRAVSRDEPVPEDLEAALRERDSNRCSLTGERDNLKATYIVPPSLLATMIGAPGYCP